MYTRVLAWFGFWYFDQWVFPASKLADECTAVRVYSWCAVAGNVSYLFTVIPDLLQPAQAEGVLGHRSTVCTFRASSICMYYIYYMYVHRRQQKDWMWFRIGCHMAAGCTYLYCSLCWGRTDIFEDVYCTLYSTGVHQAGPAAFKQYVLRLSIYCIVYRHRTMKARILLHWEGRHVFFTDGHQSIIRSHVGGQRLFPLSQATGQAFPTPFFIVSLWQR